MTIKFEVGKKYYVHDEWVSEFTVASRTKCFVTFKNKRGEEYKSKIDKDTDGFGDTYERAYFQGKWTTAKMFVGSDYHKDYSDGVTTGEIGKEEQKRMDALYIESDVIMPRGGKGGKREGSGKKRHDPSEVKTTTSLTISPTVLNALESQAIAEGLSVSLLVEKIAREYLNEL